MLPRDIRRSTLLCCIALVMALVPVAVAAGARSGAQSSDRATLTLSKKSKRALSRKHVRLQAVKPATDPKSHVYFPQASGVWNFTTAKGTVVYSGGLRLRSGRHSVKLTSLSFTRGSKGASVNALRGKRKLTLFKLKGRAHVTRHAGTETITGYSADLTAKAAKLIDRALHSHAVKSNENLGSFAITVNKAGTASSTNGLSMTLTKSFTNLLKSSDLPIAALLPSSGGLPGAIGTTTVPLPDGSSVTLPEGTGSASFNSGTLTGTIPLSGGLQLGSGSNGVTLSNGELTLGTGTEGSSLSFSVNGGPEVKLFNIDTSALEKSATSNGSLDLSGLTATLSSEGADTINQLAGHQVATTNQPVAGLTAIVPSSSSSPS
jgi:hypothetical protein